MHSRLHDLSTDVGPAGEVASAIDRAHATMAELDRSSAEIGEVVKLITSIARQTNLLALNATIEAARAGAAGRGFTIVAGEVKQLAQEAARATDDIARRVQVIQAGTAAALAAIDDIRRTVDIPHPR